MADGKSYRLLSINQADNFRNRIQTREKEDGSLTLDIAGGYDELKSSLDDLLKQGCVFHNCVMTTHGGSGSISFGGTYIDAVVWYKQFYKRGYERLFPFSDTKLLFNGCNVAEGANGWAFLEAAARVFARHNGGLAMAWTSVGFGSFISGHVRHFWGGLREVVLAPDDAGGANLRFYEDGKRIDNGVPLYHFNPGALN